MSYKQVIPRVTNYAKSIVPLSDIAFFQSHFWVTPALYDIMFWELQGYIVPNHGGGTEHIEPSNQLLIFLPCMASQESFREKSLEF